jgi:ketosteroid isomerase-like protein
VSTTVAPAVDLAPRQTIRAFVAAINAGDSQLATRAFAKDACLLTPDATAIAGREEIRPLLAQLIARQTQIEVLAGSLLIAGPLALGSERWRICSSGADEAVFEQLTSPALVLRWIEGAWKLAIAAPWGWG